MRKGKTKQNKIEPKEVIVLRGHVQLEDGEKKGERES